VGRNPTDRGKIGTKRSLLTEGNGLPVAVVVAGANRNDFKLFQETMNNIVVQRPTPGEESPQGICLDKGYDVREVKEAVNALGLLPHIRTCGEEKKEKEVNPGFRAHRWVVERTHSWMNRFRRILVRWEVYEENYLGMLHLVCGLIVYRTIQRLRRAAQEELLK
jgi:putative transposase